MALVLSAAAVRAKRVWRKLARTLDNMPSILKIKSLLKNIEQTATFRINKSFSCPALQERKLHSPNVITYDTWLKTRSEINFRRTDSESSKCKTAASPSLGLLDICCSPFMENFASYAACPPCPPGGLPSPSMLDSMMTASMCPCPCGPCGPCGPCCGPCGPCYGNMADCNCGSKLPPPCSTPPQCIQYMQGYYYYPYGTWFCGPYHVNTGAVPVCGPACPGNSCGPAPPNPNILCGCSGVLGSTACFPSGSGGLSCLQGCGLPGLPPSFGTFSVPNTSEASYQQHGVGTTCQPRSTCEAFTLQESLRKSNSSGATGFNLPLGTCFVPIPPPNCGVPCSQPSQTANYGIPCPQPSQIANCGVPCPQPVQTAIYGVPCPQPGQTANCGVPCPQPSLTANYGVPCPQPGQTANCGVPCPQPGLTANYGVPCPQPGQTANYGVPCPKPGLTSQSAPNASSNPNNVTSQASIDTVRPVVPKWVTNHAPCQCVECLASRAVTFLNNPKATSNTGGDAKLAWRGINADLIERGTSKCPKDQALAKAKTVVKERPNYCEMLINPKAKR